MSKKNSNAILKNAFKKSKKIYEVYFYAKEMLDKAPKYSGEDEWLEEQRLQQAERKLQR